MKYLAAYMLAELGGNSSPSSSDVEKILSSVGIDAESEELTKMIESLSGKSVEEVLFLLVPSKSRTSLLSNGGCS